MSYRGKEKLREPDNGDVMGSRHSPHLLLPTKQLAKEMHLLQLKVLGSIALSWILLVHFAERTSVRWTINRCQWNKWENKHTKGATVVEPHRVALLADPQLVDGNSYPDRPNIINYYVKKLSDNYLHRNYRFIQYLIDPDTIVFLGDLFDGGREWNDQLWFQEYKRFNDIFPSQPNRRTIQSIPGNHDIGFETIDTNKLKRFVAFFGANNDVLHIGNHTVMLLDDISLSSEDQDVQGPTQEFLNLVSSLLHPQYPRVLMTHVPLFRDNKKQVCGPRRESDKPFPVQKGKQYQTVIAQELTNTVLETIRPSIIFAGDDHDYCEIEHILSDGQAAKEITVKAVSMTAGILYPAFQMLSLHNPVDDTGKSLNTGPTYTTEMCYLPNPFFGITLYVIWLIGSLLVLAVTFLKPVLVSRSITMIEQKIKGWEGYKLPVFNTAPSITVTDSPMTNTKVTKFGISAVALVFYVYMVIGFYYRNV